MLKTTNVALAQYAANAEERALDFARDPFQLRPRASAVSASRQIAVELTRRIEALKPSQHLSRSMLLRSLARVHHALNIYDSVQGS